jgi:hypothetical protein
MDKCSLVTMCDVFIDSVIFNYIMCTNKENQIKR